MPRRSIDTMLRGMDPAIADLLTSQPQPRLDPDEAERRVRASMANEIDDLKVAWQVCQARERGSACRTMIEHFCMAGSYAECIRVHGYMKRCAGPVTLEVHEDEQRRIAEWPALSARLAEQVRASVDSIVARRAATSFREAMARSAARR